MNNKVIENCQVEIHADRGVIYVHHEGISILRISGLTPKQCQQRQIDVSAVEQFPIDEFFIVAVRRPDGSPPKLSKAMGGSVYGDPSACGLTTNCIFFDVADAKSFYCLHPDKEILAVFRCHGEAMEEVKDA